MACFLDKYHHAVVKHLYRHRTNVFIYVHAVVDIKTQMTNDFIYYHGVVDIKEQVTHLFINIYIYIHARIYIYI